MLCKWAACEFKAGDEARAEELLARATAQTGNELAVAYSMLIEVIRLKLHGSYKTRFNKAFNEGLAAAPSGKAATGMATATATHHAAGVTYLGQKTHQKKVLDYLKKAEKADYTKDELENLCVSLLELKSNRLVNAYTKLGQEKFPKEPLFPFLQAQIESAPAPRPAALDRTAAAGEGDKRDAAAGPQAAGLLDQIGERFAGVGRVQPVRTDVRWRRLRPVATPENRRRKRDIGRRASSVICRLVRCGAGTAGRQ